ncbi:MAG: LruC domain-containing protein [Bacteroidaceae bacterium]|nr:LruC domain-containing protein [Bacteroidaceae bacterium]
MKKITFILSISVLVLTACQDFDYGDLPTPVDENAIRNAVLALGVSIDTSHDWSTTNNGSITIIADADLEDVAKVQILTESPFYNVDASVLAEVNATKGETVTLTYDAPKTYTRLIAACRSSNGVYYIKGFDVGTEQLSFTKSTRAAGDVASDDYPDLSKVKLEYQYSTPSYNARRTILANEAAASGDATLQKFVNDNHINLWEGKLWEKERLWGTRDGNRVELDGGWYFENNTVARVIDDIDEDEAATLKDIFDNYLGRTKFKVNGQDRRQDNMASVRNSDQVSLNNNYLISTGQGPITITPVLMASADIYSCHLYYYYYNPSEIPNNMTEDEYLKTLPKFRAMRGRHTFEAAGIDKNKGSENFFKKHEYLLPYYGEPNKLIGVDGVSKTLCQTDGKLYRIRNGQALKNNYYYMTYVNNRIDNNSDKLDIIYNDNDDKIANQLWQIFKTPDGLVMLYNVGSQKFLCQDGTYATVLSDETAEKSTYVLNQYDGDYWRIWSSSSWNDSKGEYTQCLGTDLTKKDSKRVSYNKGAGDGERSKWYLEPYVGSKNVAVNDVPVYYTGSLVIKAVSNIIPKGYRIGFMLRKAKGSQNEADNSIASAIYNGCCYGDRRLNQEINQFPGHFGSTTSIYSMAVDDPRMAVFEANGNVYMTFEDGSDCNFSDLIIQLGGSVSPIGYIPDVFGQVYTFCFEDREEGDYDMNDIVIKAERVDATHVTYSIEACGGTDKVYLRNIHGNILNEKTELHSLFNASGTVNAGSAHQDAVHETIEVEPSFSFADESQMFYIYNATTGKEIHFSKQGEDPHAIMIPEDFRYPLEGVCIKDAYPAFVNWAKDRTQNTNWYLTPEIESVTYKQSVFQLEKR